MVRNVIGTLIAIGVAWPGDASASGTAGLMPWTPETSIAVNYFKDQQLWERFFAGSEPVQPVLPSPDGRRIAFVVEMGDLLSDENISVLQIYDIAQVIEAVNSGRGARILRTITCRTRGKSAISDLRWSDDGRRLTYLNYNGDGKPLVVSNGIYELDVESGEVSWLMDGYREPLGFCNYLVSARGGNVLYVDYATQVVPIERRFKAPVEIVTDEVYDRVTSVSENDGRHFNRIGDKANAERPLGLFLRSQGATEHILSLGPVSKFDYRDPPCGSLNPSGTIAILTMSVAESGPTLFSDLTNAGTRGQNQLSSIPASPRAKFVRLDFRDGILEPLALSGRSTRMGKACVLTPTVLWSGDGTIGVLINTTLPDETTGLERSAWIAAYYPETKVFSPIAMVEKDGLKATAVRWSDDGRALLIRWESTVVASPRAGFDSKSIGLMGVSDSSIWTMHVPRDGRWSSSSASEIATSLWIGWQSAPRQKEYQRDNNLGEKIPASALPSPSPLPMRFSNGLEIILEEGPNHPQQLLASLGDKKTVLFDTSAAIERVKLNPSRVFEWRTPDGKLHRGMLTLPTCQDDKPVPLVVQIYAHTPNVFRPDGGNGVGSWARQVYAARGFAVLDVACGSSEITGELFNHATEIEGTVALLQAAIDKLVVDQLVDPDRLGVQGFSHGGYQARIALLHPRKYRFRAAAVNDSTSFSPPEYFRDFAWEIKTGEDYYAGYFRQIYSGTPSVSPEQWIRNNFEFGAKHASGALLNITHAPDILGENAISDIAFQYNLVVLAARAAGRPAEFAVVASPRHGLIAPRERVGAMYMNVDWMEFWLKGHTRTEPTAIIGETAQSLAERNARWRRMEASWERQQSWESHGHSAGSIPAKEFKQDWSRRGPK